MKSIADLSVLVVFPASNMNAQTFKKITSDGWDMESATSKPAIADIDDDGLLDRFIGEWAGRIAHFEQDETGTAAFSFVTNNFSNITTGRCAAPSIIDFDNDGLLDLIIGDGTGALHYHEQNNVGSMEFTLVTDSLGGIEVSNYAVPHFTDIDGNGLLDLLVGRHNGTPAQYKQ